MYKLYSVLLFMMASMLLQGCNEKNSDPFFVSENAIQQIAGDSIKTWKLSKRFNDGYRMNMGDCFLSYRVSYLTNKTTLDNNRDHSNCGVTFKAQWEFTKTENGSFLKLTSDQIPAFFNSDKNYKYFKILALSENQLTLQFKHTQYASTATTIVDHLVPEDVTIEDRDFHH